DEGDEQHGCRTVMDGLYLVADSWIGAQLLGEGDEIGVTRDGDLAVEAFHEVAGPLAEVDDAGSDTVRVQAHAQDVHRRLEQARRDTVAHERHGRGVGRDEIPAAAEEQGW